jgi:hypothetical protein
MWSSAFMTILPGHCRTRRPAKKSLPWAPMWWPINRQWQPEHGGILQLHRDANGPAIATLAPRYNTALGFVLHEASHHSVTQVTRSRRSVVFNFWHAANSPELAQAVATLFADLDFASLPSDLDAIAADAEAHQPETVTFRASLAALELQRWGFEPATIVVGYRAAVGLPPQRPLTPQEHASVLLAGWLAWLREESFDLRRWAELLDSLRATSCPPRLAQLWPLCLPATASAGHKQLRPTDV